MMSHNGKDADAVSNEVPDGSSYGSPTTTTQSEGHLKSRIIFHIICLLWLVPIAFMLVKNFQVWIIGASAWCPDGRCWADIFDTSLGKVWSTAHKLDQQSQDLLGGLQFVAKALEVWFIIIASSLVYLYTMFLAERTDGLPVRYLTWPAEFSDITSIFDRSFWTTAYSMRHRKNRWVLPLFVAVTALLCILCAVMGPAVAVTIIPSLQWIPTPATGQRVFDEISSASPPAAEALLETINEQYLLGRSQTKCSVSDFTAGNYSCTADTLGSSLDSLVAQWVDFYHGLNSNFGLLQQGYVSSYMFNISELTGLPKAALWTPNRQLLSELAKDRAIIALNGVHQLQQTLSQQKGIESYAIFNRSLEMRIQRNGPMIGARPNFWFRSSSTPAWTTQVDSNRSIRCYQGYSITYGNLASPASIRCIRIGTGWNTANKRTDFSMSGIKEPLSGGFRPGVNFSASFSDQATFLKGNVLPSWLPPACLSNKKNGNVPTNVSCDWERLFSADNDILSNRTKNVNTWDVFRPDDQSTPFMSVDFVAYTGVGLYQLDPSPAVNPLTLVQTLNVPNTGPPLVIDPQWAALAFSADVSGVIPTDRTAPLQFVQQLEENPTISNLVLQFAVFNMLTQLPYSTLPHDATTVDSRHPVLERTGLVYVYAYRINSRTSQFSVVVVIAGMVVVLAHAVLGIWYYRPQKSIKEVVIAALEHRPQGDFVGATSSKEAARTRFKVEHTSHGLGEMVFRKPH